MIWVVLGGSSRVWQEYNMMRMVLPKDHVVIATNDAGVKSEHDVHHWATLHPEKFNDWIEERKKFGNADAKRYSIFSSSDGSWEVVQDRWGGSSGLYATQIALSMGAKAVILCGCPMQAEGRHFFDKDRDWSEADMYRSGWIAAMPVIRHSVRSCSGWTQEQLGPPSSFWLRERGCLPQTVNIEE